MTIRLTNTATRKKEEFVPLDPDNVRMYVCGPTVYDRAHLGNARPVIVFDVLYRLLRHVYGADHVTYVRNFTDVDDRINETAQKRRAAGADGTLEALIRERSDETIGWYHADMDALGALRPDTEPRATQYVDQMVAFIEDLITKGHAYAADGHVLFAVDSWPEGYGKLSGRSVDDMIAGARVEVAPYKRNPMDFVLWKPSTDDLPGWDSPWGRGRPGWHIECSAMAYDLLGDTFDIHGGGNDLIFPHHENEIAQSKCAGHGFARYWLHNEMLQVEGKKMSKSLGNFFTVRDLLDQGVPGEVIRFVFLSTHYRKPMDWTEKKREEAEATLRKWRRQCLLVPLSSKKGSPSRVLDALKDDLNTPAAIAELMKLSEDGDFFALAEGAKLLGLLTDELGGWDEYLSTGAATQILKFLEESSLSLEDLSDEELAEHAMLSIGYVQKNRAKIAEDLNSFVGLAGQLISSIKNFSSKFEKEIALAHSDALSSDVPIAHKHKIVDLLERRIEAKANKDWAMADEIRSQIEGLDFRVIDTPEGPKWIRNS